MITDNPDVFNRALQPGEDRILLTAQALQRDEVTRLIRLAASHPESRITALGVASMVANDVVADDQALMVAPVAFAIIVTE